MGLTNRDKDVSEQKDVYSAVIRGATHTISGATYGLVGPMPYPCTIQSIAAGGFGFSGAPEMLFRVARLAAGGFTSIQIGISNLVIPVVGTSGFAGYSGLAVTGSTLLMLQRGDCIFGQTAVAADSGVGQMLLNIVVKKTQDIVSHNGTSS